MQRKRKTVDPCEKCRLHRARCICEFIPNLNLKTRLSLVVHYKELKRTTNSGALALHALVNSEMIVRGEGRERRDLSDLIKPGYENVVLYPSPDALDVEVFRTQMPVNLIVSDGNWRQAGKLNVRHPELAHLPRVKIGRENSGKDHLRKEHNKEGFSTLEAIAIAIGALEGESAGAALRGLYQAKLKATLEGRGIQ